MVGRMPAETDDGRLKSNPIQAPVASVDKQVRRNTLIQSISSSSAFAAYQANQAIQPKTTAPAQSAQPPKQDTVHLRSATTGDVDNDGDSH